MKENLYQKWRQESDVDLMSLLSSCIVHQKALTIFVPAKKKNPSDVQLYFWHWSQVVDLILTSTEREELAL